MKINHSTHHLFIRQLTNQLEASWLELLKLTTACAEEGLVDHKLLHYELMDLRQKINEVKSSQAPAQLEACLNQCEQLFTYYAALRRQTQRQTQQSEKTGPALGS